MNRTDEPIEPACDNLADGHQEESIAHRDTKASKERLSACRWKIDEKKPGSRVFLG